MMKPFPRPAQPMMMARKAAFEGSQKRPFDRQLFATQAYRFRPSDNAAPARAGLIDLAVDHLTTYPDGRGIGYFLVEGVSRGRTIDDVRNLSFELLGAIWERFRSRSRRFTRGREFFCSQALTEDGKIPIGLYGSRWSFKPPHADRNGILCAHVYGPTAGYEGGDVFLLDAIAYVKNSGLRFEEALTWSDEPTEQKPVLRPEHVEAAMRGYGRRFGRMDHDKILFFKNTPEGLFHGATELHVCRAEEFLRMLHRSVVRERT